MTANQQHSNVGQASRLSSENQTTPGTLARVANKAANVSLATIAQIEAYLRQETEHAERLIETSRELQSALHKLPTDSPSPLPEIFATIETRQRSIDQNRAELAKHLHRLPGRPKNLSSVLASLPGPEQKLLRSLRSQLFNRLETVRSITMGSQMVLYYTVDFYQRLIRGITGCDPSAGYSPAGRTDHLDAGSVMTRNC